MLDLGPRLGDGYADRAATARNKALWERVKAARTADEIRALL